MYAQQTRSQTTPAQTSPSMFSAAPAQSNAVAQQQLHGAEAPSALDLADQLFALPDLLTRVGDGIREIAVDPLDSLRGALDETIRSGLDSCPQLCRDALDDMAESLPEGDLRTVIDALSELFISCPQHWDAPTEEACGDLLTTARTAAITGQDAIYESIAKTAAYGIDNPAIASWGLTERPELGVSDPVSGFGMCVFEPAQTAQDPHVLERHGRPVRPVVAFRGTDVDDLRPDLITDFVDDCIGMSQFRPNEAAIQAACASAPDVIGHSLGGALAQIAGALCSTGRVVTFQAPGISAELAAQADPELEATHFRVDGDMVGGAGEALLDGEVFAFTQANPTKDIAGHKAILLADLGTDRGVEGLDEEGQARLTRVDRFAAEDALHGVEDGRRVIGDSLEGHPALITVVAYALELLAAVCDLSPEAVMRVLVGILQDGIDEGLSSRDAFIARIVAGLADLELDTTVALIIARGATTVLFDDLGLADLDGCETHAA